jgi:hypothetical protein
MTTTRVALLEMSPRLRQILSEAIAAQQDLELVPSPVLPRDGSPQPDVLVREVPDPLDPEIPAALLGIRPGAQAVMIGASGEEAALYEFS